jgi:hypothetical protein
MESAMKRTAKPLFAALLLVSVGSAFPAEPDAQSFPVLAQDLTSLKGSRVVSAALWTRRPDSYTLQLVLGPPAVSMGTRTPALVDGRRMVSTSAQPQSAPQTPMPPSTNVWLLRADGTQIPSHAPSTTPAVAKCTGRCIAVDVQYRFSVAEATQAVAVAVRIGDEFFIEKLRPLEPTQN